MLKRVERAWGMEMGGSLRLSSSPFSLVSCSTSIPFANPFPGGPWPRNNHQSPLVGTSLGSINAHPREIRPDQGFASEPFQSGIFSLAGARYRAWE